MQLVFPEDLATSIPVDDSGAKQLAKLYAFPDRFWVRAMMNTSIDGRVAGDDGTSASLHNPEDSLLLRTTRALADAIVVGAETVRLEEYRQPRGLKSLRELSLRPAGKSLPELFIFTNSGNIPAHIAPGWPAFLVCAEDSRAVVSARSHFPDNHIISYRELSDFTEHLHQRGLKGVQVEGGPGLLAQFSAANLLNEICVSTSFVTVAGKGKHLFEGAPLAQHWSLASQVVGERALLSRYLRVERESN